MTTYTTHTQTPDRYPYNSELIIDTTLLRAAERAANAKLEPLPAEAHQLYILKKGSGRPYPVAKKPRHEAIACQRCGNATVLVNRLPVFPAEVGLPCGHRVNLKAGPELVMDAALFRTGNKRRALAALKLFILPQPGGLTFGTGAVRLLKPAPPDGQARPHPSPAPRRPFLWLSEVRYSAETASQRRNPVRKCPGAPGKARGSDFAFVRRRTRANRNASPGRSDKPCPVPALPHLQPNPRKELRRCTPPTTPPPLTATPGGCTT